MFNHPFREVGREYLLAQEARAKRGEISAARPKKVRAIIEGALDKYVVRLRSTLSATSFGAATYVFDVSQTEGAELPELREISGDVGENRDRLIAFIEQQGIELVFTERIAPALGMSYGGRIAILPGQSKAEEFSTLVHELAHLCIFGDYVV